MSVLLSNQVYALLQELKISVSHQYLEKLLISHPDYPSLLSITDTLDELGIENASLVVDKERLQEIPVPFLAHLNEKGKEFVVVSNIERIKEVHPEFLEKWDGIIVAAEKLPDWKHQDNDEWLNKEKIKKSRILLAIVVMVGLIGAGLSVNFSWAYSGIILTSLIGLGVAVLIVQQELGISNAIVDQVCGAGIKNDCRAVIRSTDATLIKGFGWSDAGIIYFSSFSLMHLLVLLSGSALISVAAPLFAAAAIPFTFYSIYYQWRVIKKWCRLCLAIVSLLVIQFAIYWPQIISYNFSALALSQWIPVVFMITVIAAAWLLWLKPLLKNEKEISEQYFSLVRFKNNTNVFTPLLHQQRRVDITSFPGDIELGDPQSNVKMVVACNPYCGPCASAHMLLHSLIEKNNISLRIRFTVKKEQEDDKKTIAVKHILQVIAAKTDSSPGFARQVVHDWFKWMDYEKFKTAYPVTTPVNVNDTINSMDSWARDAGIRHTPTVFINGLELPSQYKINEIAVVLKELPAQSVKVSVNEDGQYTPV